MSDQTTDQERYCAYCNGDHRGTDCPRRHPGSDRRLIVEYLRAESLKQYDWHAKNALELAADAIENEAHIP
jgi:hypothetical protein